MLYDNTKCYICELSKSYDQTKTTNSEGTQTNAGA